MPASPDHSTWFVAQVQPHAPALRSYLLARYPTLPDVDNLVQECLVRVLRAHEITALLGKSPATVKNQVSTIFGKIGVATRTRLIALLR